MGNFGNLTKKKKILSLSQSRVLLNFPTQHVTSQPKMIYWVLFVKKKKH